MGIRGAAEGCRTISLRKDDLVDARVYQGSGAPLTFSSNSIWNWLTVASIAGQVSLDNSNAFTAATGSFTRIPYNTELYTTYNGGTGIGTGTQTPKDDFDVTQGVWTAGTALGYLLCASVAPFTADFEMDLFVNNAREKAFAVSKHGAGLGCRPTTLKLNDKVDVRLYQAQTPSLSVSPNSYWNWLTINAINTSLQTQFSDIAQFAVSSGNFAFVPYSGIGSGYVAQYYGDYLVCSSLAGFTENFELDVFINGSRENAFAASNYGAATGCQLVRLKAQDTLQIGVYQNRVASLVFSPNGLWNWLSVFRVDY